MFTMSETTTSQQALTVNSNRTEWQVVQQVHNIQRLNQLQYAD